MYEMLEFPKEYCDTVDRSTLELGRRLMQAAHTLFGVPFSHRQWAAMAIEPPRWDLNPPQREEYDNDEAYAMGEREYADRVIEDGHRKGNP